MKTYNRFIFLLSIVFVINILNIKLDANNEIFEIITPETTNSSSSSGSNSLFNLEDESNKSKSRDWENNPFDKSEDIIMPDTMMDVEVIEESDPLAYKLKAIWKRNNTYKALISGYIIKENETINTIKILKITNNSIIIEINEEEEEHILGSTFYED